MPDNPRARRGDLAVLEIGHSYAYQEPGKNPGSATEYRIAIVTSITRDGHVKAVRDDSYGPEAGYPTPLVRLLGFRRLWLVSGKGIDVPAAQEAARENRWPSGHTGMPFASLDDVREALRPHINSA